VLPSAAVRLKARGRHGELLRHVVHAVATTATVGDPLRRDQSPKPCGGGCVIWKAGPCSSIDVEILGSNNVATYVLGPGADLGVRFGAS
jgi:hypothetical protein